MVIPPILRVRERLETIYESFFGKYKLSNNLLVPSFHVGSDPPAKMAEPGLEVILQFPHSTHLPTLNMGSNEVLRFQVSLSLWTPDLLESKSPLPFSQNLYELGNLMYPVFDKINCAGTAQPDSSNPERALYYISMYFEL